MESPGGICSGKCAKTFIQSLEERQDIRNGLERGNGPQAAEITLEKETFAAWIGIGGSYDELCLFVSHQLLHVYCYSEVTLIGRGQVPKPHVMRHDDWSRQMTLLQAIKSAVEYKYRPCCAEDETPKFDVVYVYGTPEHPRAPSLFEKDTLIINVLEGEHNLTISIHFAPKHNGSASKGYVSVNRLMSTVNGLFDQVAQNPNLEVRQLQFCLPSHQLLGLLQPQDSTHAISERPPPSMAHIFEAQVQRVPSKIGLIAGNKRWTYAEINETANQVRNAILATSSAPKANDLIALCLDRTELIIFAILGVWKAGRAYVPIDPSYPAARMSLIFDDCRPILILTDGSSRSKLPTVPCPVLDLTDAAALEKAPAQPSSLSRNVAGSDLALVIYTSGTTGQPKGVMIEQRSLVSQCEDYAERYSDLSEDEVVVQLFNYAFNAFMEPVTLAFSHGICLVMVPFQILLEPAKLLEHLRVNGVTHIDGTPSLASQYNLARVTTLKRVAVGGEPLTPTHHSTFLGNNPRIRVYNIYGNSEGTLCTLTADVTRADSFEFRRQVRNKRVYLVSSGMKLVPPGAIGELCLAGAGVVRGYLNNQALTDQNFVPNPFRMDSETAAGLFPRLYRTGDLGVGMLSGGIAIVGRKDLQVKIRGIRVEISEIENGMLRFPGVLKTAVIWTKEATGNQLIGFFTGDSDERSTEKEVKAFLLERLPEYMVPSRIHRLPSFPLTPNGKIDRNQLHASIPPAVRKMAPEGEKLREESPEAVAICEIWEEVLSLPPNSVDRTSNFFSLGGNSLLAIKVMSMMLERLGIQPSASRIMERSGSFESFLTPTEDEGSPDASAVQIPPRRPNAPGAPLSTSQERIWNSRQNPQHHITFTFEVARGVFEVSALLGRISNVLRSHEILRTVYPVGRFRMKVQKVVEDAHVEFRKLEGLTSLAEFVTEPFDLSSQLPLRVGIILELGSGVQRVVIIVHAIAMDSPAQALFLEELSKASPASMRGVQYGDYALFQKNFIPEEEEKKKVSYWREFMNSQPPLFGPTVAKNSEAANESLEFSLDRSLFQSLREVAQELETSLYAVFLSAQMILQHLMEPSNQEVTTGTVHFSRDHPQLYQMQGNFSQLVPLSLEMDPKESVKEFIARVEGAVKKAKAMQIFPIDVTAGAVGGTRNLVKQRCLKFVFHAGAFPQPGSELELKGSVLRLVEVKGDSPTLEGTHEIYLQVDTSVGTVMCWRRGGSAAGIKRLLDRIFNELSQGGRGHGNVVIADIK